MAYKIALRVVMGFLEKKEMSISSQQQDLVEFPLQGLCYYIMSLVYLSTMQKSYWVQYFTGYPYQDKSFQRHQCLWVWVEAHF